MQGAEYTLADPDFYAPVHHSPDPGRRYRPARIPAGWTGTDQTVWTIWHQDGAADAEQGWKVHVSARYERAQHVLDTVAGICFAEGVRFKHLSAALYFLMVHHKHGPRVQAGRFCAAYPAGVEEARRLMELLRDALRDEDGPYVLTDRRFADSRTVHYRYGAYVGRSRVRPDGTTATLVRDGHGGWVEDRRFPGFVLLQPETGSVPYTPCPARGLDGSRESCRHAPEPW